jgi:hypothetical protein
LRVLWFLSVTIGLIPVAIGNPYGVTGADWTPSGTMVNLGMPAGCYAYSWDQLKTTNIPNMVRPVRYWEYVGSSWTMRPHGYLHETDEIVDPTVFGDYVTGNPGRVWIIGNEPDLVSQDGLTREQYAAMFHTYHTFISGLDPSAEFAVGALTGDSFPGHVESDIAWWEYVLDHYRTTYGQQMPVDVWNFHCYSSADTRDVQYVVDIYVQPFIDWVRTADGGAYASTEIWCTEFGIGFWHGPLNAEWVAPFMQRLCLRLEDLDVDRWFWFVGPWVEGDFEETSLLDPSKNPTVLGQVYSGLANNYPNTTATPMPDPAPLPPPGTFTDDFETGGSELWIDKAGDWEVADGTCGYRFGSSEPHWWGYYTQLPCYYTDFSMEADVRIDSAPDDINWAGLYFRFPVMFGDRGDGGYLVYLRQNGELGLHNQQDGTVVSVPGAVADTSVFHRIRVKCTGDPAEIDVSVDDTLEISWTDPNGRFPAGFVALEGGHAECTFDNVVIENLGPSDAGEAWRVYR